MQLFSTQRLAVKPAEPAPVIEPAPTASAPPILPCAAQAPCCVTLQPGLGPSVLAATIEGIPIFPIPSGSRHFEIRRSLWSATTDMEALAQMAAENPECSFGMAMGDRVFAVRLDGEFGVEQFNSMIQYAIFTTDDSDNWSTRLLQGGNTTWALYLSPEFPERRPRPFLGDGLSFIGRNGWIPAPGADSSGKIYRYLNPETRIAVAPRYIARLAFEIPDAEEQFGTDLESPEWSMW